MASDQPRANKLYSFKDEHVVALFKLLQKSNRLKLSEIRCPEEVGKTDDRNYCLYHRMLVLAQRPITLVLMMINSCSYSTNDLVFNQ